MNRPTRARRSDASGSVLTEAAPRTSAVRRARDREEMQRLLSTVLGTRSLRLGPVDRRRPARLRVATLPHVVAAQVQFGADGEAVQDGIDDCYLVHLPVTGTLVIRTRDAEVRATPEWVGVVSPPGGAHVAWQRDTVATVLRIDRAAVEAELVDLTGLAGPPADPALAFQSTMDATGEPARSWRATALFIAENLGTPGSLLDHPLLAAHVERLLLRGLLVCHPHTYSGRLASSAAAIPPRHVREAVLRIQQRPSHPFTVATLARSVGVSARALQDGFRQHLGMSPMQYLRTIRLRGVREELLGLDPEDSTTVAEVATRWGFTHLGRFAQYYRARYGEPPSRTLRGP